MPCEGNTKEEYFELNSSYAECYFIHHESSRVEAYLMIEYTPRVKKVIKSGRGRPHSHTLLATKMC